MNKNIIKKVAKCKRKINQNLNKKQDKSNHPKDKFDMGLPE